MNNRRSVRLIDKLGRIKLPADIMKALTIKPGDHLEFFYDDGTAKLRKSSQECVFCGQLEDLHSHKSKMVCIRCMRNMDDLL